jgi:hypothetical protein
MLPTADCRLPTADCRLPTADCRLPTADCRLHSAFCILLSFSLPFTLLNFSPHNLPKNHNLYE